MTSLTYYCVHCQLVSSIRSSTTHGQILFELTSMLRYGCAPPHQKRSFRDRVPPLALVTAAHLAFQAGADGLAAFNLAYYRSFSGPEDKGHEPPFSVLASARNRSWTAAQPQLYFLSANGDQDSHTSNTRLPMDLGACMRNECQLKLVLAPPTQGWTQPGILRLNLVASPWRHSAAFRACPTETDLNLTAATSTLNVTMNGVQLRAVLNPPPDSAGWSSWPDESFASFRVPLAALNAGGNSITLAVPPQASESSYVLVHSGAPGGDGRRWHFPFPYTASSWVGPRINGSTYPGLSLIDCERQCDLNSRCKGLYYGPGPGDRTCYTLNTLVLGNTGLSGASYRKKRGGRTAMREDYAIGQSVADLTLIYVDLSLPSHFKTRDVLLEDAPLGPAPLKTDDDDERELRTASFDERAEFAFSAALSSDMVLQREPARARLWGTGQAGAVVAVDVGETFRATVGRTGRWSLLLPPQPAGLAFGTGNIVASQRKAKGNVTTLRLSGVTFGEVWLCTGQVSADTLRLTCVLRPRSLPKPTVACARSRTWVCPSAASAEGRRGTSRSSHGTAASRSGSRSSIGRGTTSSCG